MTPLRIFVRRGALRRFHRLKKEAEGLPVKVEWDRRLSDRRVEPTAVPTPVPVPATAPAATEQRRAERRREPPFTWRAAEFVVVDEPATGEPEDADSSDVDDPDKN